MTVHTTARGFPYPDNDTPPDFQRDFEALAVRSDGEFIVNTYANIPAPGVVGREFYASDRGRSYVDIGSAWIPHGGAPPLVSVLPPTPYEGQEVYFQTATMETLSLIWHLRYRGTRVGGAANPNTSKWEVLNPTPWSVKAGSSANDDIPVNTWIDFSNPPTGLDYGSAYTFSPLLAGLPDGLYDLRYGGDLYALPLAGETSQITALGMGIRINGGAFPTAADGWGSDRHEGGSYQVSPAHSRPRLQLSAGNNSVIGVFYISAISHDTGTLRIHRQGCYISATPIALT